MNISLYSNGVFRVRVYPLTPIDALHTYYAKFTMAANWQQIGWQIGKAC